MTLPTTTGKILVSLAALVTGVGPIKTDWSTTHVFSPAWSPHARFHGAAFVGTAALLAPLALWSLWRPSPDPDAAVTVGAALPIAYWAPFFLAARVPGAGIEDPGFRQPRILGIPSPLLTAGATVLCAGLGWHLDRAARSRPPR